MDPPSGRAEASHWQNWHAAYDDPASSLARRLRRVQARVREALDDGARRILSVCAGAGRDVIEPLTTYDRRAEITALLVELDPALTERATLAVADVGLTGVGVVTGDASTTDAYAEVDLALVCGVFGNIDRADVRATIRLLPSLLAPRGRVIWTRHRREPDLTPDVRRWFAEAGFVEHGFDTEDGHLFAVGVHDLVREPDPFRPGLRMFRFLGDGADAAF